MPGSKYEGSKDQSGGVATGTRPSASAGAALPWWLYSIVMLGAVLMAMGAVVALVHPSLLVSPHDQINGAVHIYAGYLAARNLALAFMLLAALGLRARGMLNTMLLLTACVQLLDTLIDCAEGRWAVAPGVLLLGIFFLVAAARLSGHAFWRIEAWKQPL